MLTYLETRTRTANLNCADLLNVECATFVVLNLVIFLSVVFQNELQTFGVALSPGAAGRVAASGGRFTIVAVAKGRTRWN